MESTLQQIDKQAKNLTIEVPACFEAEDLRKFREEVERQMNEGFHPQEDSAENAISELELEVMRLRQENALLREDRDHKAGELERAIDLAQFLRKQNDLLGKCIEELTASLKVTRAEKARQIPTVWPVTTVPGGFSKIS